MLAVNPTLTPKEIKDILYNTAHPLSNEDCRNGGNSTIDGCDCGGGLLDAYQAVLAAQNIPSNRKNVWVYQFLEDEETIAGSIWHWEGGPTFREYPHTDLPKQFTFLKGTQDITSNQKHL
jgi:hypothetical protein